MVSGGFGEFKVLRRRKWNLFGFISSSAYCKRGEAIFNKLSELVDSCKDLTTELRTKLADEELLSNNIVRPGKR